MNTWFEDYVEGCTQEDIDSAKFDMAALSRAILEKLDNKEIHDIVEKTIEGLGVSLI